jgi:hypothetical protein
MHRTKFTVARAPCVSLPKHLGSISKRPARFASSHNMAPIEAMRDLGEEERELLISTRNESDGVSVEVRDSGPGFTPAVLTACSKLSTPRNPAVWDLGCRSAGRLSKRITDHCGRAPTCPAAPAFNSPCRRSQTLRRDAAIVSRPKEQGARPRIPLWVKAGKAQCKHMFSALPPKANVV